MTESKGLVLSIYTRVMTNDDMVILTNRGNGAWIKISKEVFLIIKELLEKEINPLKSMEQVYECDEDEEFLKDLWCKLEQLKIICSEKQMLSTVEYNLSVSFSITKRCNLSCKHCSYSAKKESDKGQDLTTNQVISSIEKILAIQPEKIVITGGEPMLRSDFWVISNYLRDNYDGKLALMTNGTFINSNNAKDLVKIYDSFDISMDGVDEISCSEIRGKGVYGKVVQSIELLKAQNAKSISVSMVLVGRNQHLLTDFLSLCRKLGVKALPRHFISKGRGEEFFDYLNEKILDVKHDTLESGIDTLVACCCNAGIDEIFIDANGNLYPCPLLDLPKFLIDNILNPKFDLYKFFKDKEFENMEIYKGSLSLLPDALSGMCKTCNVNQFCLKCPADYLNYYGIQTEKMNLFCKKFKECLERIIW